MTDKAQPDNARNFEGEVDVPTYEGNESKKGGGLFNRPGRAEPQNIEPNQGAAGSTAMSAQQSGQAEETPSQGQQYSNGDVDSHAQTTAFESASTAQSAPAQTGAQPATSYQAAPQATSAAPQAAHTEYNAGAGYNSGTEYNAGVPAATAVSSESEEDIAAREEREREEAARKEGYRTYGKRGTIDFGLLFIRLALGLYLVLAGASTFFRLGGNEGLAGLEAEFASYAMPNVLAIALPTMQLIAGVFLILGLVTPLAAMIGLIATGFSALHALAGSPLGLDVFAWTDAVWLPLVLFVIAVALQFTGPGFISLDFGRSWARRPLATSWIFVVLGVAALVAIWMFGAGVNPLA